MLKDTDCTVAKSGSVFIGLVQAWGELIVNANALIMHSFFQVVQGNA